MRTFSSFGDRRRRISGWLRQILRNDINRVRRQYVEAERRSVDRERRLDDSSLGAPELVDLAQTPGTDAVLREEARLLKEAMEKLPENYIQVIRLRDWEELSFPEIGRTMNLTEEAARKLWKRAITRLEEILESQMRSHESVQLRTTLMQPENEKEPAAIERSLNRQTLPRFGTTCSHNSSGSKRRIAGVGFRDQQPRGSLAVCSIGARPDSPGPKNCCSAGSPAPSDSIADTVIAEPFMQSAESVPLRSGGFALNGRWDVRIRSGLCGLRPGFGSTRGAKDSSHRSFGYVGWPITLSA